MTESDSPSKNLSVHLTLPVWPTFSTNWSHCKAYKTWMVCRRQKSADIPISCSCFLLIKERNVGLIIIRCWHAHILFPQVISKMVINLLSIIWILSGSFAVFHQNVGVETSWSVRGMPCLLFQYAGTKKHSVFFSISTESPCVSNS